MMFSSQPLNPISTILDGMDTQVSATYRVDPYALEASTLSLFNLKGLVTMPKIVRAFRTFVCFKISLLKNIVVTRSTRATSASPLGSSYTSTRSLWRRTSSRWVLSCTIL